MIQRELLAKEREKTFYVRFLNGATVGFGHERTEQAVSILMGMITPDLDGDILHARTAAAATTASRTRGRRELQGDAARFARGETAQGQVAEHEPVTSVCFRIGERAFYFEPLEGNAGHAVGPGKRIDVLFFAAVHAGPEKSHGVSLDGLVCGEQDFDLANARFGREVERTQRPRLPGALGVDADRFIAATGPDFVAVGPVVGGRIKIGGLLVAKTRVIPVVNAATADPDGIAFHADAITACGRGTEAPAEPARIGENAGDAAYRLALFVLRAGDGAAAGTDIGLSVRIEDGEVEAVSARVALARPEIAERGLPAGRRCG